MQEKAMLYAYVLLYDSIDIIAVEVWRDTRLKRGYNQAAW